MHLPVLVMVTPSTRKCWSICPLFNAESPGYSNYYLNNEWHRFFEVNSLKSNKERKMHINYIYKISSLDGEPIACSCHVGWRHWLNLAPKISWKASHLRTIFFSWAYINILSLGLTEKLILEFWEVYCNYYKYVLSFMRTVASCNLWFILTR